MRKVVIGLVLVLVLAVPSVATAGGWATAALSPSKPPEGSGPGDRWVTTVRVLQHGVTPLAGVKPVLVLTDAETAKRVRFPARPTSVVGVYRVTVKLPATGTWDVAVYDGFTEYGGAQTHTFAPITIGAPTPPVASPKERPAGVPAAVSDEWPTAYVVLVLLIAAVGTTGAVVLARRSRRKAPAAT